MKVFALFIAGFALNAHFGTALHYPQYLQAFSHKSCIGTSTDFLESNVNITGDMAVKSVSLRGIWVYKAGGYSVIKRSFNGRKDCLTTTVPEFMYLDSVVKLASGDLDDSVLTLYPNTTFEGEPLVIDDGGLNKANISVWSWALTGPQSFTLYDGEDFTGNATCLEPESESKNDGRGISLKWVSAEPLLVRSVRLRCDSANNTGIIKIHGNSEMMSISRDLKGAEVKGLYKVVSVPKLIVL